ncbi:MAG: DNA-3-methyladenine glycosylase I [Clostridia bacterium]|nr:DNA-3-methyladenine glycosylase I [Clostridia bacterium]
MQRCGWCNERNAAYVQYHDSEWCVPSVDDRYLFEMLVLESFQAGLSWECILNKRNAFREAYDNFDIDKVSAYGEDDIARLMGNTGIVRNRRKIAASISNARIFKEIVKKHGSFYSYLTSFTEGRTLYEVGLVKNGLSDRISADLQKRGMKFVGSVITYSYLQAIGIIYSHEEGCFLYGQK